MAEVAGDNEGVVFTGQLLQPAQTGGGPATSAVPFGLPPVLPSLQDSLDAMLDCPGELPLFDLEHQMRLVPREPDLNSLFAAQLGPAETTIDVRRDPTSGELIDYEEVWISEKDSTAKNSLSLTRAPGKPTDGLRGSTSNYPFWPGGLDYPSQALANTVNLFDSSEGYETVAPGFESGPTFLGKPSDEAGDTTQPTMLKLADIMRGEELGLSDSDESDDDTSQVVTAADPNANDNGTSNTQGGITPNDDDTGLLNANEFNSLTKPMKVLDIEGVAAPAPKLQDTEWAIALDMNTPVDNFYTEIPDMAYKWPFELDIFQKQAILRLEKHENVFVAAHTSAGKTVVAEYAIALSKKHGTRTVYTSPIKALSNQKFRDFKITFEDVGLVTGDIQINQTASCLIMTTEILRSMLYGGSDVIRDLEYVIFDEVHYINDVERGVVWEEVLIMLPKHVNIILLSATVPNYMEFADWVGRTKKSKVYVISTPKRPVPLEHFIYTGNSSKTSSELFLLIDSAGRLQMQGYRKAMEAKKERLSKASQTTGSKGHRQDYGPHQDKNIWISVIGMLRKTDKLPAVAFVFSKKKIDDFSFHLMNQDLTTSSEKSAIHVFFTKSISRLKSEDQKLPQVRHLRDLLTRGIGIHHSGVLPIIKEIVELLFQKGLIKILFATETFAMGVNMPARTVVFDVLRKFDGSAPRNLKPGEYTQMAGRAGRRGLDATGTVITLCKGDVPDVSEFTQIMQGKPTQLESQFRLTYSMILNLLRVEQLRVEDMLKRSFSEFTSQKNADKVKLTVDALKAKVDHLTELDCPFCTGSIDKYYLLCKDYWRDYTKLLKHVSGHPSISKVVGKNRVVLVSRPPAYPHSGMCDVALILDVVTSKKEKEYKCLILTDVPEVGYTSAPTSILPRPVAPISVYKPYEEQVGVVVSFRVHQFACVADHVLKHACDKILSNVEQRKMDRFRGTPPSQSVLSALGELKDIRALASEEADTLRELDLVKELSMKDIETVELAGQLRRRKSHLLTEYTCLTCPSFYHHFRQEEYNGSVRGELNGALHLLSEDSLELLPEYLSRVNTLQCLGYIDSNKRVKMKGQVACEIGQREVLITELILENVFNDCDHYEIAALLSSIVFEQKRCSQPNLNPKLQAKVKVIQSIAERIGQLQARNGMEMPTSEYVDSLRFELTEVVYEWAQGMPFCEITNLTDAQEGIIVRTIQRLDELLRDVRSAAKIIGNRTLYKKMDDASVAIKRDIVFAASLYTQ